MGFLVGNCGACWKLIFLSPTIFVNSTKSFTDNCSARLFKVSDFPPKADPPLMGGTAYMGDAMRDEPFEFQHKARCGEPGTAMPTFSDNDETAIKDMLKAGQDTVAFPGF